MNQFLAKKNRISKEILKIILRDRKQNQWYVEPFCGGCNAIDKVDGLRMANDFNEYLIALWKALQEGWIPPSNVSKELYTDVRLNKDKHTKELVCFIGFLCAFGGKWFGGYAKNSKGDNYAERGARVLIKQIEKLKDVKFFSGSYDEMVLPYNSVIYCDPPYESTTSYKDKFDHKKFWQWCREMTETGHKVFISEYNAPEDFECVWEKEVKTILNKNSQSDKRVEKLFVFLPRTIEESENAWVSSHKSS